VTTAETVTTGRMECVKHGNNVTVETVTTAETVTTGRMEVSAVVTVSTLTWFISYIYY
jgi:hypothetical protein